MRGRIGKLVNKWTVGVLTVMLVAMAFVISAKAETTGTYGMLTYRIWAYKNEAEIIDCDETASGEVIIPEEIEGYPVKTICFPAFRDCSEITNIVIPKSVTSIGGFAFANCSSLTSITIPESVTSIGDYAFSGCENLQDVYITDLKAWCNIDVIASNGTPLCYATNLYLNNVLLEGDIVIPEGVTSIGNYAFYKYSHLTSIQLPESVISIGNSTFSGCSSLTSIQFPERLTSIGSSAFYGCSNLTSIQLPESVTSIGDSTFNGCSSLTSIQFPERLTSIGSSAFKGCSSLINVQLPESVTSIGASTFNGCSSLTSIQLPEGLTSIENSTFRECSSLINVQLPESVTSIGNSAFNGCSSLKNIQLPEGLTSIGIWAFTSCKSLTSIKIPEGVTNLGEYVFGECGGLTSIIIPKSITSMGPSTFVSCPNLQDIYITDLKAWCNIDVDSNGGTPLHNTSNLYLNNVLLEGDIVIPEGVTSIGNYAFYKYSHLTSVQIPEGVTNIGTSAFYGCSNLTSIQLPESVTSIGNSTFGGCSSLTSIQFPERLTNIGTSAFYGCSGLTSIQLPEGITNIGASTFYGCSNLTNIQFPEGVTSIGDHAFYACNRLTNIRIPKGVTNIGKKVFSGSKIVLYVESAYAKQYAIDNNISYIMIPESISITTLPNKMDYCLNEELDTEGLVVTAICNDGSTEKIQSDLIFTGFDTSKKGTCTITVSYLGKKITFDITVHDKHQYDNDSDVICSRCEYERLITDVDIKTVPTKQQYCLNEELNLTSLVLTIHYSDGTTKEITSGFEVTGFDSTKAGTCNVTITYGGKTATYAVMIQENHSYDNDKDDICNVCDYKRVVERVEIQTMPSKTVYCLNKELDLTSLVLRAHYSDGTTKDITSGYDVKGFDSTVAGSCEVQVSYEGKSTSYHVTVNAKHTYSDEVDLSCNYCEYKRAVEKIEIKTMPSKTGYCPNEELDLAGLVVRALYGDGTTRDITSGYEVSGFDSTKAGTCNVVISYGDKKVSYSVTVREEHSYDNNVDKTCNKCEHSRAIEGIKVCKMPVQTIYCLNQKMDLTGLVVEINYNDGTAKQISEGYDVSGFDSVKAGEKQIVVSLDGKTTSFKVTVNEQHTYSDDLDLNCNVCEYACVVNSIEFQSLPNKLTYRQDEKLDLTGLVLNVNCNDGSLRQLTTGFEVSKFDSTQAGEYKIYITYAGHKLSFDVVVEKYVATSVVLDKENIRAYVGEKVKLTVTCIPSLPSAEKVVWSSNDESVATVDQDGNVTTLSGGVVTITASVGGKQATCTITILEGEWVKDSKGYWYKQYDGSYPHSEWKIIDGNKYYFDASGYRATGWASIGGKWYYFNTNGLLVKNQWIGVYYTDENGKMVTNSWVDNGRYYVDASGAYVATSGWFQLNGKYYYLSGGLKQTGWVSSGGVWYYMDTKTGIMLANEWLDDTYYFHGSGAMATGWTLIGGKYYYFEGSGAKATNRWIGNYYLKADGVMATNEVINGYHVGADGATINGWKLVDGKYYYYAGGLLTKEWLSSGGVWYYMDAKTGAMYASEWLDDTYYFKASGAMATGWTLIGGKYYYFEGSGAKVKNRWIGNYYMKADGVMATSEWVDNGKYYVDANGVYVSTSGWFQSNGEYYYLVNGARKTGWFSSGGVWYYLDTKTGVMYADEWLDDTYYFNASGAMVTGWKTIDGNDYYFDGSGAKEVSQWIGDYYVDAEGKKVVGYPKSVAIGTCPQLNVGDTYELSVTLVPSSADVKYVTWTSSDESVATIENGVVKAIAPGYATITATVNGKSDTCFVRVKEISVTSVSLDITSKQLYLGESFTLQATVAPTNATYSGITWTSSNESIATVENGVVTAVSQGTVKITAQAGIKKATCTVLVKEHPYSVGQMWTVPGQWRFVINSVEPHTKCNSFSTQEGEQVVVINYTYYNDGYIGGTIQPELYIRFFDVYDENGEKASIYSCTHTTLPKELEIGTYCTASVSYILPSKSDNIRIDVSKAKGGSAIELTVTYNVEMPYIKWKDTAQFLTLNPGDVLQAAVDTNYSNDVKWSSLDTSVVTVDSNGKITAKGPGLTFVDVSAGGAKTSTMIQVNALEVELLTPLNTSTNQVQLRVTNLTDSAVKISECSSGAVTTVDTYPLYNINGVNSGTATIGANSTEIITLKFETYYGTGRTLILDEGSMVTFDFVWENTEYQMQLKTTGSYIEGKKTN